MTQDEYSHLILKKRTIIGLSTFESKKLPLNVMQPNNTLHSVGSNAADS